MVYDMEVTEWFNPALIFWMRVVVMNCLSEEL